MNNLRTIFESEYKGYNFIYENLILQVFRNVKDLRSIKDKIEDISESEKKQINSVKLFAQISKGAEISFFDVEIKEKVNLPRSRVTIQNFVKKIINNQSCAVIFFHYADNNFDNIWRVSFVYVGKNNKDSTNAKRYTYICGKNQHCRTITQRFTALSQKERIVDNDLIEAFAVQSLSEDFFAQYKVFYEDFVQYITGNRYLKKGGKFEKTKIHEPNPIFEKFVQLAKNETNTRHFESQKEEIISLAQKYVRDYIKKLMGRLVFLQFLQKKGWLGVEEGKEWGSGDKSYLQKLFEKSDYQDDFLEKVLEPLFFNTLNKVRENDIATKELQLDKNKKIKIPYLNGGLFENDKLFDDIKITFPKQLFSNPDYADKERHNTDEFQKIETKKECGLLDFFAQYNFTIDETDPNDVEIGVDPEMLGKIFENLLEDNKDKGAFYTPKEIVQYMCQESLIAYLTSDLTNTIHCEKQSEEAILFESNIRNFIKSPHNISSLSEEQNRHSELVSESKISYPFTEEQETYILQKLKNVKICDPAVGSGAFPMGMLNLLYACRSALEKEDDICKIKKSIVKDNIYGVDIEKGAIDIARLRFWLSIIVDEKEPIPLPNLDYKLMQGNSLIESFEGVDLSTLLQDDPNSLYSAKDKISELQKSLNEYYEPNNTKSKEEIKKHIKEIVQNILKDKGYSFDKKTQNALINLNLHENSEFFLWHTWFNDVFNRSNNSDASGFDIVIGNPPYIRVQNMAYSDIDILKQQFKTAKKRIDISLCFIELSKKLINSNGVAMFITSNQFLTTEYGKAMREFLLKDYFIKSCIDLGDLPIFDSAMTYVSIFLFQRENVKEIDYYPINDLNYVKKMDYGKPKKIPLSKLTSDNWNLKNNEKNEIFNKMNSSSILLNEIGNCNSGLITGCDKILMFDEKSLYDLDIEKEILLPVLRAENCSKYYAYAPKKYVIYPYYEKDGKTCIYTEKEIKIKFPKAYSYLLSNKKILADRKDSRSTFGEKGHWYGLIRFGRKEIFNKDKIISPGEVSEHKFCIDRSKGGFSCARVFAITLDNSKFNLQYILGILNSSIMKVFIQSFASLKSGGYYQYSSNILNRCPIPLATASEQSKIASLVDKILDAKKTNPKSDTTELENQIDTLVYKLYGLTDEEIAVVECK